MKGDEGQKYCWAILHMHVFGIKCFSTGHYCTCFLTMLHAFGLKCDSISHF